MFIRKIELYKYKRFFLSQLDHFTLEPKSNIIIMAWGNGKGKSSLLSMLNPLPAELKRDFKEDGYKYIEILHKGHEYKISSGKIEKNKHSFIRDDIELNPGGTKRVQLELSKEHFNITPNVNNILLGIDRFTLMPPNVRKSWFSELSTIDYTYPISIYNKLKIRCRDLIGSVKLLEEDIGNMVNNSIKEDEYKILQEQRYRLEEYILYLVGLHDHNYDVNINNNLYTELSNKNTELKNLLSKNIKSYDTNYYNKEIAIVNNNIEKYLKSIKDIQHNIHILEESNITTNSDINTLYDNRKILIKEVLELRKLSIVPMYNIKNVYNAYNNVYSYVVDIINKLSELDRVDFNIEKIKEIEVTIEKLNNIKQITLKKLNMLEGERNVIIRNMDTKVKTICPLCNAEYQIDITENKKLDIEKDIEKYNKEITTIDINLNKLTKYLDNVYNIKKYIEDIVIIFNNNPILKPIIDNIDIDYNTSCNNILLQLDKYRILLDKLVKYVSLHNDIKSIKRNINRYKDNILAKQTLQEQNIKILEDKLKLETIELNNNRELLKTLTNEQNILVNINNIENKIKYLLKTLNNYKKVSVIKLRNKYLTELVNELKHILVDIDSKILQYNTNKNILNKKIETLNNSKVRIKVLNNILEVLSPTDGIIARSINSFLNIFIREMNHIINSIWSYEMVLLPCEINDENDLDYKFRVLVNNDVIIEDISRLSSSMQEIVDLAYKIVFMKYMGLNNNPLILDEFGRTMDVTHRTTAYNIIDKIFSTNFEQIFLVSHFESMYGRFVNADIVDIER